MDEKQYGENQAGYDKDTFGEIKRDNYRQEQYDQNIYGQNAQQTSQYTSQDGGSFYDSPQPNGNGFGIASMVLGILAIVLFCGCINIPLAILSIIFAVIHINRKTGSIGFAIAGIVTSVISVILTVFMIVAFFLFGTSASTWMYSETLPFEYFMDDDNDYDDGDFDYYDYDFELNEENAF